VTTTHTDPGPRGRLDLPDVARGVALVAMAIYHFAWDLEFFGYAEPGMTAMGGWKLFARSIAGSFLFLVGVSLVLAHRSGVRWRPFLRRLAMVAAAALVISLATWLAMPQGFIFFGILHQIAFASVAGLLFLRSPALVTAIAAAAVLAAPHVLRADMFNHPALWWVGLSTQNPRSNDFVPVFPWFGMVLAGMAATRFAGDRGILAWLSSLRFGSWAAPLRVAGRHSLAVYLIHQPLLIGLVWLFALVAPPAPRSVAADFDRSCQATCGESRDIAFCVAYCDCVRGELQATGDLERLSGAQDPTLQTRVSEAVAICSASTETAPAQEDGP
jgi:uncharacterized membrane protein